MYEYKYKHKHKHESLEQGYDKANGLGGQGDLLSENEGLGVSKTIHGAFGGVP